MLVPFPGADAMPYAHLWFLRNLLLYSVLLAPLFAYVRTNPDAGPVRAARWTVQAGGGLALMTVPALILGASAILTKPWHYGEVGMWWEFPTTSCSPCSVTWPSRPAPCGSNASKPCVGGCWRRPSTELGLVFPQHDGPGD